MSDERDYVLVNFRMSKAMHRRMLQELDQRNSHPTAERWNLSEWLRQAVVDKMEHAARSRKHGRKRKPAGSPAAALPAGEKPDEASNNPIAADGACQAPQSFVQRLFGKE